MLTVLLHGVLALLIVLQIGILPLVAHALDTSEYQSATYGPPTHYCDLTLSIVAPSGSGTIGDPWNATRCMSEPVAGNVVGIKSGVSVLLTGPSSRTGAAFTPANSGTAGSRIVYVCQHPAISLDYATIDSNADRCELRHNGAESIGATPGSNSGAIIGANGKNYITFAGWYVNMANAHIRDDSGVFNCWSTSDIHFRDFVVKGRITDMDSNVVVYRPEGCTRTIVSNFRVSGFSNEPVSGSLNQQGLFSDQYGDEDFLIEKFLIEFPTTTKVPGGIYLKGSAVSNTMYNYGTVRYGVIKNTGACLQFNALHATNVSEYHHVVCETQRQDSAVYFSAETINVRNLTLHHLTITKGDSTSLNYQGCMSTKSSSSFGIGSAVNIRDSICDSDAGSNGFEFYTHNGSPNQLDYIGHYKNGSTLHWYNGTQYDSLGAWQGATVFEDSSLVVTASPFVDRAGGNYNLSVGHAWLTASSTGGELGAYEGSTDPGPDTGSAGGGGSSGAARFGLFNLRR